jgi:hypothetical protein
MKTPMQEMLERVKKYRDAEKSALVVSRLNSVYVDLLGMLEKEKEIIDESYQKGYQNGHEAAMNYTDLRKCKCGLAQVRGFTCTRTDCDQNIT